MPGPYAHITLLHELTQPGRLESFHSPASGIEAALANFFPYCALGAVSPDYPHLARGDDTASQWADAMHYTRACQMIISGIRRVREAQGAARDKQLAWLLGYSAHVATDVTIHPVVQAKVGVYAENQRQHRICEMNQDSYIYRRMSLGEIGESDLFAMTVAQCGTVDDRSGLDRDIITLWQGMLADVHPELFAAAPPNCAQWHRGFVDRLDERNCAQVRLFPLAGNIAVKMGLAYPSYETVDRQFIEEQLIPTERPIYLHYDEIFDRAADNVMAVWKMLEQAFCDADPVLMPIFGDWNLDNGCDECNRLVFWG